MIRISFVWIPQTYDDERDPKIEILLDENDFVQKTDKIRHK